MFFVILFCCFSSWLKINLKNKKKINIFSSPFSLSLSLSLSIFSIFLLFVKTTPPANGQSQIDGSIDARQTLLTNQTAAAKEEKEEEDAV